MTTTLKIVFASKDWQVESGAEVEEPLDEALLAAGVGEIVSGGVGAEGVFYNVEVKDAASALPVIQQILRQMGVPESTRIEGLEG
jgi:hypothetical protein